jgi:hypothetical protein
MTEKLIVVLTTAYLILEYGLQTSKMIQAKKNRELKGYAKYFLSYFILALLLAVNWFSWQLILVIIIQVFLFGIIDYTKINLKLKKIQYRFEIGIVDILLHFFVIWFTIIILKPGSIDLNFPFHLNVGVSLSIYIKFCIYVSAIIFLLNGGTDLVRAVLKKVKIEDAKIEKDNTGKLIGNIERVLLFIFILFNSLTAIGFVIAAKSIARFEELKHKKFAEYYLIGTLTSALLAILMGKLVNCLVTMLDL